MCWLMTESPVGEVSFLLFKYNTHFSCPPAPKNVKGGQKKLFPPTPFNQMSSCPPSVCLMYVYYTACFSWSKVGPVLEMNQSLQWSHSKKWECHFSRIELQLITIVSITNLVTFVCSLALKPNIIVYLHLNRMFWKKNLKMFWIL